MTLVKPKVIVVVTVVGVGQSRVHRVDEEVVLVDVQLIKSGN
jgi:adenylate kinase